MTAPLTPTAMPIIFVFTGELLACKLPSPTETETVMEADTLNDEDLDADEPWERDKVGEDVGDGRTSGSSKRAQPPEGSSVNPDVQDAHAEPVYPLPSKQTHRPTPDTEATHAPWPLQYWLLADGQEAMG